MTSGSAAEKQAVLGLTSGCSSDSETDGDGTSDGAQGGPVAVSVVAYWECTTGYSDYKSLNHLYFLLVFD